MCPDHPINCGPKHITSWCVCVDIFYTDYTSTYGHQAILHLSGCKVTGYCKTTIRSRILRSSISVISIKWGQINQAPFQGRITHPCVSTDIQKNAYVYRDRLFFPRRQHYIHEPLNVSVVRILADSGEVICTSRAFSLPLPVKKDEKDSSQATQEISRCLL